MTEARQMEALPTDSDLYRLQWWRAIDACRDGKLTWRQLSQLSGSFAKDKAGPTGLLVQQLGQAIDELLEGNAREARQAKEAKPAELIQGTTVSEPIAAPGQASSSENEANAGPAAQPALDL